LLSKWEEPSKEEIDVWYSYKRDDMMNIRKMKKAMLFEKKWD